jgi:N-glycosidase YbiA
MVHDGPFAYNHNRQEIIHMSKKGHVAATENGEGGEVVRFHDGEYGALSTLSSHVVFWKGEHWPTAAHAYHAAKFDGISEESREVIRAILTAGSPARAREIARHNEGLIRPRWQGMRVGFLRDILRAKTNGHAEVKRVLLETGFRRLVGGTPGDPFWGLDSEGNGNNYLGKIQMTLRAEFRALEDAAERRGK